MKEIIIQVPNNKYNFLLELLSKYTFVKTKAQEENIEIPEWQMEIVRERKKNSKPENLQDWDEIKDTFKVD